MGVVPFENGKVFVAKSTKPIVVNANAVTEGCRADVAAFAFDRVFALTSSQEEIYAMARPLVLSALQGVPIHASCRTLQADMIVRPDQWHCVCLWTDWFWQNIHK